MSWQRFSLRLMLFAFVFWAAGFAVFAIDSLTPPSPPPRCDGIAVLTGGQDRISAAFTLLRDGYGQQLLISGVGSHATLAQLGEPGIYRLSDRITLGRHAITTIGNAMEAAQWAHANALHSVIVVTAGYHIRRALVELRRAAPDVRFTAYAVQPPALRHPATRATAFLLLREYTKLLGAWVGVTRGNPMA